MIQKPPDWLSNFTYDFMSKAIKSAELTAIVKHADEEYEYWENFKYHPMPKDIKPEQAWAYLKFSRRSKYEPSPIKDISGSNAVYSLTKTMFQRLSYIDSNTSGFLSSDVNKPTALQKNQLIMSGLTEEAIASSQIEGANTSRKAAKEMLLSQRKARNKDEQMIINNYQVMQRLMEWKDLPLSSDMLLDMQKNLTSGTLDDEKDEGRFRNNNDEIVVSNRLTHEIVYTPPPKEIFISQLKSLIDFANKDEDSSSFIHPVIKGSLLHFWLAYLHPFVDGNGRTARAIFYWYMLKKNYWLFQYLSVSRSIKESKIAYDNSFLYSEYDDNDLTYFLNYKIKAIVQSINSFITYYKAKLEKEKVVEKLAGKLGEFNERQIDLLQDLNNKKDSTVDLITYKSKYRIAYETARTDLTSLAKKGYLDRVLIKNKFIFIPKTVEIGNLFKK